MATADLVAEQYALTEAAYCIVRLLQRHDAIELDPGSDTTKGGVVKKNIGASLAPVEVRVRLRRCL
jgi:hypothetical protein